jgi:hypothetical protein
MEDGLRLPDLAHTAMPWRIHEIAPDFELEDVWALPTPGARDDFRVLVEGLAAGDPERGPSQVVRLLFALRWKLGELFGWDDASSGLGSRVATLRDRLPQDLAATSPPSFGALPFKPLYLTEDEFAAEIANRTMHGVLHLGWVKDDAGAYRGQMAVLVKTNGLLGHAYMAAILPFRRLIVYPQMMRQIDRRWQTEVVLGRRPAASGV